ncbi:MAG TPA: AtpZ/AtpI family protein [Candidatus Atribacteria bacterium]|jgi:predicted F0F1-ATPase subunit|nr:AtpZ/AtpI family protein [Candidatus Atribacteria bacterium]HPZ81413.1 AtpZ/AtpI family protein [Candidatus Atribacteria bacterium]HQE25558.1 AtpZ/AtpI family protein [Candidatus Atribacteria bacterium]
MKNKNQEEANIWQGLGQIWDLVWVTVVPIILGVFLGRYLDRSYSTGFFWTLSLLVLGTFMGFYNLYDSLMKESKKMESKDRDKNGKSNG